MRLVGPVQPTPNGGRVRASSFQFFGLIIFCLLLGCDKRSDQGEGPFADTLSGIETTGRLLNSWEETTPIVWKNQLLFVHSIKQTKGKGDRVHVIDENQNILGLGPDNFGFVSALVVDDTLYVFGVTEWGEGWRNQNQLRMTSSKDLKTWTDPIVIKSANVGQTFYNSSMTPSPSGYTLAYEVCETGLECFSFRFLESPDLQTWTEVGQRYAPHYSACPTLRYVDGFFYAFYLAKGEGKFFTVVARSTDLKSWTRSPHAILTPWVHAPNGLNASDMDLVEFNGHLEIVFIDGNQTTTGQTQRAR